MTAPVTVCSVEWCIGDRSDSKCECFKSYGGPWECNGRVCASGYEALVREAVNSNPQLFFDVVNFPLTSCKTNDVLCPIDKRKKCGSYSHHHFI